MQAMKHSLIALAVAAVSSQLALAEAETKQADAKGFIEGASAQVLLRNTYWNRDWKSKSATTDNAACDNAAWAQGFIGKFESGFTQGGVGFGLDAFGLLGVRLDGGAGKAGASSQGGLMSGFLASERTPNGKGAFAPRDEWGHVGAAVKARLSSTVLKYGHQMPELPVLSIDDSRVLPESFTGTLLTSNEVEGLQIDVGRFTQNSPMAFASRDPNQLKSINIAGARYTTNEEATSVALYGSRVEDSFRKLYTGAYHSIDLGNQQSVELDFNLYRTKYYSSYTGTGESEDNTIWSLQSTYNIGGHGLILAYQKSSGDRGYEYDEGDGGGTIWLANSFFSDFNSAKEKSLQLGYSLNFSDYGVEGLSWRMAYVVGKQPSSVTVNGKKANERDFYNQVQYTVQNGSMKDLTFKVRNGIFRSSNNHTDNGQSDLNEWRLFVEYPLDLTF